MGAWCSTPAPAPPWPRRPAHSRRLPQPHTSSTVQIFDSDALIQHVQSKLADWHFNRSRLHRVFGAWRRHQKALVAKRAHAAARWLDRQVPELRNDTEAAEYPDHYAVLGAPCGADSAISQLRSGLGRSRPIRTNEEAMPKPFDASSQLSRRSSALALRLPLSRSITAGAARLANATRSASDRNARAESGANAPRGMVSGRASELIPTSGTSMSSTGTTRRCRPPRPTNLHSRRVIAARVGATGSASSATRALL